MKKSFEVAQFINRAQGVKGNPDRVYYGNEFCEKLIPTISELRNCYFFVKPRSIGFTFVTPFVTNIGLKKLVDLLGFLNDQNNIEVVFNDWGVFKLIKDRFGNLKPILGRLLTKQRRDPRMLKIFNNQHKYLKKTTPGGKTKAILFAKKPPRALFEHYQASVINLSTYQEYLLSQGINRVEIDNLIWGMDIRVNKKLGVSIYLPYGYITVSRMCGMLTLTYAACKKECKKYFFQLEDESLPVPFYGIGNAIFYKSNPPENKYLEKLRINRIVYQSRLPY